jgi:Na+/melibiose symporter-like transporter
MLAALFLTGMVPVGTKTALALFVAFHATYWLGNGIMLPIATAMMADVAELHRARTGVNKDGAYSAVFSLAMRLAISFSLMASGWTLTGIGFVTDATHATQTPEAIWRLGLATFIAGPLVCVASLVAIGRYPITRDIINCLTVEASETAPTEGDPGPVIG